VWGTFRRKPILEEPTTSPLQTRTVLPRRRGHPFDIGVPNRDDEAVTDGPTTDAGASASVDLERVSEITDELIEAVRRLYPQLTDGPVADARSMARVLDAGACVLVARSGGAIVGMGTAVIATVLTGTTAHVEDVVVDTAFRGRGIGERLMRELIMFARAQGADQMTLTSHPTREAANSLYRRLGFQLGGTNYYSLDLDQRD
jgi:ribosomal protein S18 acetylase RimI-like enzyme